jgi:hypothetical protein
MGRIKTMMNTETDAQQHVLRCDQPGREAVSDRPLLLPLVTPAGNEPDLQGRVLELASRATWLVAQHFPLSVAAPVSWAEQSSEQCIFAELVYATITTSLRQGFRRLLLVPWGGRQSTGSLIKPVQKALSAVTGEAVSPTELALPPVHVDGISARTVFGGLSSVQTQLGLLLDAFPGWDRTWIRLSAGPMRIVLLRSGEETAPSSPSAAWERPTIKALTAALCPHHAGVMTPSERFRWQRDGEIYSRFLVALLGAATEFLRQELMREEPDDER